jgi:hypothetical protein
MPSKRDPSRQRRQARNRAEREARMARREMASAPKPQPATTASGDEAGSTRATRASTRAGGPTRRGAFEGRPPGTRAAYYCLILTIFAFGFSFIFQVPVDTDGTPFSRDEVEQRDQFIELEDRSDLNEAEQATLDELTPVWEGRTDRSESMFLAYWPVSVVYILAVGCGILAVVISRGPNPARGWMRLLIAMVLLSLLSGGSFLLLAPVIALGVAHFQNRKATLAASGGPPPGAGFGGLFGRRQVIDVDAAPADPASAPADEPDGDPDDGRRR